MANPLAPNVGAPIVAAVEEVVAADEVEVEEAKDGEEEDDEEVPRQRVPGPPFHESAYSGNAAEVAGFLQKGSDVDMFDDVLFRRTPLIYACGQGHVEVAELLLDNAASVAHVDICGDTPALKAADGGHVEVLRLLKSRGANLLFINRFGHSGIILAAHGAHVEVCIYLLSLGADLVATNLHGSSPLTCFGHNCWPRMDEKEKALGCARLVAAHVAYLTASTRADNLRLSAITQMAASLLFSDAFSDLVFVCLGGVRIHAHRCIVSACSPHARALLQGPWAENTDERVAVVQLPQSELAVRAEKPV